MTYTQVQLKRDNQIDTAWVETKLAQLNRPVRLKIDGDWQEGWVITDIYGTMPEALVRTLETAYRTHRSRTDI